MVVYLNIMLEDVGEMVDYIMSLVDKKVENVLLLKGSYIIKVLEGDKGEGVYIICVVYDDQGVDDLFLLGVE